MTQDENRAFNQGCDARLSGRSLRANPYDWHLQSREYNKWALGWNDVDCHWAEGVRGRWYHRLPAFLIKEKRRGRSA